MKINKIFWITLIFMLLLTSAEAQYVYVDIPDTTLEKNGDFFDLDVNNDSLLDFRFTQYRDTGSTGLIDHSIISPFDSLGSHVHGQQRGFFFYADNLQVGDDISLTSSSWQGFSPNDYFGTIEYRFDSVSDPNSQWKNNEEGFIGVSVVNKDSLQFAWVRIQVEDGEHLTIKDYAYQQKLDSSILAGHLWISIESNYLPGYKGFVSQDKLILVRPKNSLIAKTTIYNSDGKILVSGNWVGFEWSMPINIFKSGFITIVSESKDGIWVEKIFIAH
tara:strand:- start:5833 stop:6654 length:822 start_codon:yes stop_codon:yes gene_type:complete